MSVFQFVPIDHFQAPFKRIIIERIYDGCVFNIIRKNLAKYFLQFLTNNGIPSMPIVNELYGHEKI